MLDLVEQVAREQDGHVPVADERSEQIEDLGDAERVDRGRRLIEDQNVGILDERIGDAEALEHAARVGVGAVVGARRQADLLEDLVDRVVRLDPRDAVQRRGEPQVLATREVAVEADRVGEVPDTALDFERTASRIEPDHPRLAFRRLGEAEEHQDGGRLAGAVLAEEPEDLARRDLEVEVVDGDQVAVHLREPACPDRRARAIVTRVPGGGGDAGLALGCAALAADPRASRPRRRGRHRRP